MQMDGCPDQNLLKALNEVKQKFENREKRNVPLLIDIPFQLISWLMAFLPHFLGKGSDKNDKSARKTTPTKPILVVANNADSHYSLQHLFSKAAILTKRENFTTYVVPTALRGLKSAYDYDIVLAGTHHFEIFAEKDFSAVVLFESNYLQTDVVSEILNYFPNTFALLVRTIFDERSATELRLAHNFSSLIRVSPAFSVDYLESNETGDEEVDEVKSKIPDIGTINTADSAIELDTISVIELELPATELDSAADQTSPSNNVYFTMGQTTSTDTSPEQNVSSAVTQKNSNRLNGPGFHMDSNSLKIPGRETTNKKGKKQKETSDRPKWSPLVFVTEVIRQKIKEKRRQRKMKSSSTFSNFYNRDDERREANKAKWKFTTLSMKAKTKLKSTTCYGDCIHPSKPENEARKCTRLQHPRQVNTASISNHLNTTCGRNGVIYNEKTESSDISNKKDCHNKEGKKKWSPKNLAVHFRNASTNSIQKAKKTKISMKRNNKVAPTGY